MIKRYILVSAVLCFIVASTSTQTAQKILSISVPKAGTHLLAKCIRLLRPNLPNCALTTLQELFKNPEEDALLWYHIMYMQENVNMIKDKEFIGFLIIRDPRDQLVSRMFWTFQHPLRWPDAPQKHRTLGALLLELINDGSSICMQYGCHKGINDLYQSFLPWRDHKEFITIKFENLVGPKGGGSAKAQRKEVKKIARHLGLTLTKDQISSVCDKLFGGTHTFREGKIGSWKTYFKDEHKKAFKSIAGQLLIDLGYEKDLNW